MSNQCEKQESRNYKNQLTKFNYDLIDTYIVLDKYIDRRDFELCDFEPLELTKTEDLGQKMVKQWVLVHWKVGYNCISW